MIPQAKYAVDLLPQLPSSLLPQVAKWHIYCDGSHYAANAKHEEACAMACVIVGETVQQGVSTFYIADVIAVELGAHDVTYRGSTGADTAEAMALHWATL